MKYSILTISIVLITQFSFSQKNNNNLDHMIGQMLMIGFRDTIITDTSQITKDIKDFHIGGVVLYEYDAPSKSRPRNITSKNQLKKLTSDLQKQSKTLLFIGIDEEGGLVSRLKTKYGFLPTVSPQYLGNLHNLDSSEFYAKQIALACKSVGVNMNFAPSVDVNTNPECPVIGKIKRSYSANPDSVSIQANIFLNEHQKQGIFCTIKHFPGHGSAKMDSHLGFTDVSHSWQELELIPFQNLLASNSFPMVMTSHVFNKNIDSIYPATLSKVTLDILRKDFNYQGIIISDDMMMRAIAENYGLEEAIKQSINAGVDILIFSNNIETYNPDITKQVLGIMKNLVINNVISMERIEESYNRILNVKKAFN